jgi:hypothetical protein
VSHYNELYALVSEHPSDDQRAGPGNDETSGYAGSGWEFLVHKGGITGFEVTCRRFM